MASALCPQHRSCGDPSKTVPSHTELTTDSHSAKGSCSFRPPFTLLPSLCPPPPLFSSLFSPPPFLPFPPSPSPLPFSLFLLLLLPLPLSPSPPPPLPPSSSSTSPLHFPLLLLPLPPLWLLLLPLPFLLLQFLPPPTLAPPPHDAQLTPLERTEGGGDRLPQWAPEEFPPCLIFLLGLVPPKSVDPKKIRPKFLTSPQPFPGSQMPSHPLSNLSPPQPPQVGSIVFTGFADDKSEN